MRLMLNAHGSFAIPAETSFFPRVWRDFVHKDSERWRATVVEYLDHLEQVLYPPLDLDPIREVLLRTESQSAFASLLEVPLAAWAKERGKTRWGEKSPFHIFYADLIVELFSNAFVVVIVRDPRSTVASMNRFTGLQADTAANACLWSDVMSQGYDTVLRAVPGSQRITIRYEDLVEDPGCVAAAVCSALGEAFEPAMLSFHNTVDVYVPHVRSPKLRHEIQGDPTEWKALLSPADVAVVETICAKGMAQHGYMREGRHLTLTERVEVASKLLYIKAKQRQHRAERYHPVTYPLFAKASTVRPLTRS